MKKKGILIKLLSLSLLLLLLSSLTLPVLGTEYSHTVSDYDISKEGSEHNKTASSADILEKMLTEKLSEAERSYLVAYGDLNVKYDDGITTAKISATLDNGILDIAAYEYSYLTSSGVVVNWIPKSASLGSRVMSLTESGGIYTASFEGVAEDSELSRVDVIYGLDVRIEREKALELLNKAKNDIPVIEEEIARKTAAYDHVLAEYREAEREYLDFLDRKNDYDSRLEQYNEYVIASRIYEEKLREYNEYLAEKELYDAQLALREQYEKELAEYEQNASLYTAYLEDKKEYETALFAYNDYLAKSARLREKLNIIEFAALDMTDLKRSALDAINGDVVSTVLKERDSLESNLIGAPPKVITLAGESTDNLRVLLNDYFSFDTEQGKYSYYKQNYEAFRDNFVNLFISLDHLYKNSSVASVLYEKEKDEKYRILVAQLYLISMALSDGPVRSVSRDLVEGSKGAEWYVQFTYGTDFTMDYKKYTVSQILQTKELLADKNNATPDATEFPETLTLPCEPEEVLEPTAPTYVPPPAELIAVQDPAEAPAEISHPGQEPTEVPAPGTPPKEYIPPQEYTDLIAAKDEIYERTASFSGDYILTLKKAVSKKFIDMEEVNVKFYSENGDILLYEITVDSGTAAGFEGAIPQKQEDAKAVYTFAGWQNGDGVRVSLSEIGTDLILYPYFEEEIKSYTVTFDIKGERHEAVFPYGAIPVFEGELPSPEYEGAVMYCFDGWDKEPCAVVGDTVYEAVFKSVYIAPSSQGGASITVGDEGLVLDYGIAFDRRLDVSLILERAKQEGGLKIISPYLTLSFGVGQIEGLIAAGAEEIIIDAVEVGESVGSYSTYKVDIRDGNGSSVGSGINVKITDKSVSLSKNDRLKLFYIDGEGKRRYSRFSLENNELSFSGGVGVLYTLAYEYVITVASGNNVALSAQRGIYSVGENVELSLELADNVRLKRLYYKDSEGNETDLKNLRFRMPDRDLTLMCVTEYIRYKITYVSEGTVISTVYCIKGQLPAEPEAPIKQSDGINQYKFSGWSEDIVPADSDRTYYAVFEQSPVEVQENKDTGPTFYQRAVFTATVIVGAILLLIIVVVVVKFIGVF